MAKYARLRERAVLEGVVREEDLDIPAAASDAELLEVHTHAWVDRVRRGDLSADAVRRLGFPWSPELVERSRRSVGATIEASRCALRDGASVNLAGGTHHAFADYGEGFCVFNDVAVAFRVLQREERVRSALVVDTDVHQGNGTARIFADEPAVFTVSLHCARNYPFKKERSDLDVALPTGTEDAEYLDALDDALRSAFAACSPDLVFFVSGADPFAGDRLGRLALTREGLAARDRRVFAACRDRGAPVAVTMAGGYAREVDDIVDIHLETVRQAKAHAIR